MSWQYKHERIQSPQKSVAEIISLVENEMNDEQPLLSIELRNDLLTMLNDALRNPLEPSEVNKINSLIEDILNRYPDD